MNSNKLVEQLVENIRKVCRDKHISIMQMESDLGFSAGLISRWSKTKTSPSFDKIVDIMNYLDITYDDLMSGVGLSGGAKVEKTADGDGDNKILVQLEKGTSNGTLMWERAGEDLPFEVEVDIIFPHMLTYDTHRCYYAPYGRGWFMVSVQYSEDTADVLTTVYILPSAGMNIEKLEQSEERAMKLLRMIDEESFNTINRITTDKMKEEFLSEAF